MSNDPTNTGDPQVRYALAATRYDSLNNAVAALASKTNEHALILMGLMKKLGVTPAELLALVSPDDFINPSDNALIEDADEGGKIKLS